MWAARHAGTINSDVLVTTTRKQLTIILFMNLYVCFVENILLFLIYSWSLVCCVYCAIVTSF